jgi:hypothetical protein
MQHITATEEAGTVRTNKWVTVFDMPNVTYKSLLSKIGKQTPLDSDMGRQIRRLCENAERTKMFARTTWEDKKDFPDRTIDELTDIAIKRLNEQRDMLAAKRQVTVCWNDSTVKIQNIRIRPDNKHKGLALVELPTDKARVFMSLQAKGLKYGEQQDIVLDRHITYPIWWYDAKGRRMAMDIGADVIAKKLDVKERP